MSAVAAAGRVCLSILNANIYSSSKPHYPNYYKGIRRRYPTGDDVVREQAISGSLLAMSLFYCNTGSCRSAII